MLHDRGLEMRQVPIDRPSGLCLAFMKRQFGLSEFLAQSNAFVVFDEFWVEEARPKALLGAGKGKPKLVTPVTLGKLSGKCHYNPINWTPIG
jgi:hypothetical protein